MAGFEDSEVRIEHAATRHGAIEKCLRTKPDLLILDLTLPDGDGFSLRRLAPPATRHAIFAPGRLLRP